MTDGSLLASEIKRNGLSRTDIACKLGISRQSLWKKMNNLVDFKVPEMETLIEVLNLDAETSNQIFFNTLVG